MINFYYDRIKHLKFALPIINDIELLKRAKYSDIESATMTLSNITLKYESDLQKIALYYSGRNVVKGKMDEIYKDYSSYDITNDCNYLINCLIVIGAVKYGVVDSIEHALEKIKDLN